MSKNIQKNGQKKHHPKVAFRIENFATYRMNGLISYNTDFHPPYEPYRMVRLAGIEPTTPWFVADGS